MSNLFSGLDGCGAEISDDGLFRYTLTRQWSDGPCVSWLMFNPSVADATVSDATVRKCIGFSKRWGYGRLVIINLYAIRSTDPRAVSRIGRSAIGTLNNYWIAKSSEESREMICAWGCSQHAPEIDARINDVMSILDFGKLTPFKCLGFRKDGHPRHPLMLAYDTPREPFVWRK